MDENNELFHHITAELINEGIQLIDKVENAADEFSIAEKESIVLSASTEFNETVERVAVELAPSAIKVARGIVSPDEYLQDVASALALAFRAGVYCGRRTSALKSKKD